MTGLTVNWGGNVDVTIPLGEITITESFYPLCGMTVETTVETSDGSATVLPDSFLQRAVF